LTTYRITPNDTLFFRGGEPMEMSESHFQTSIFPPSPETFFGAIRTSVIAHKADGDFHGYISGVYNDTSWFREIGLREVPDTFKFTGPFLIKNNDILFPAPANLFIGADKKSLAIASPRFFNAIKYSSSVSGIMWIGPMGETGSKDWKPFKGYITLDGLNKYLKGAIESLKLEIDFVRLDTELKEDDALFKNEARTGIALKKQNLRTARSGHLYMTSHKRFAENVGITFILEGVSSLPDSFVMRLGGENRTVWCEKIEDIRIPSYQENVEFLVTMMPIKVHGATDGIPVTEFLDNDRHVILPGGVKSRLISYAVNKPELFGGWDLTIQKSKVMCQYVPAGSVFYFEKCSVKGRSTKYLLGGNNVR